MPADDLTVAVTGPTGDLGRAVVAALERSPAVRRIVGMARRPFEPASEGWRKTEYRQGDVRDRGSVRDAVAGADVVVHLAFAILTASDATRAVNVDGSRIVFEEAARAGTERLCYASSVAAYGFRDENPDWLDEDVPAGGSERHPYSAQKAEVERLLAEVLARRGSTRAWVFRPPIIAGPRAQTLLEELPYVRLAGRLPGGLARLLADVPVLKPVLPDPGVPFQLAHEDDVAAAFLAGVLGRGKPGPYNVAPPDTITVADLADALGWHSLPVPGPAVDLTAEVVTRVPGAPSVFSWIHAVRKPVLMHADRARRLLGWRPRHNTRDTLAATVAAYRSKR